MPKIHVSLAIASEELLRWYAGGAQDIAAQTIDGRSVRFPAEVVRPFVTHQGVFGLFEISFSAAGQFQTIQRIDSKDRV